jgi:hypothetical protein
MYFIYFISTIYFMNKYKLLYVNYEGNRKDINIFLCFLVYRIQYLLISLATFFMEFLISQILVKNPKFNHRIDIS